MIDTILDSPLFPWAIGAFFIGAIIAMGFAMQAEQDQWNKFAVEHECIKVGEISGSSTTAIGIGTNGQTTITPIFVPGKTGYSCDDGVTYWR